MSAPRIEDFVRDGLARALYADGESPVTDENRWLATSDGTPNQVSYELADRVLAEGVIADVLDELARQVEWKYRAVKMSHTDDGHVSDTKLHDIGRFLRDYGQRLRGAVGR